MAEKNIRVQVVHGKGQYKGKPFEAGDTLSITPYYLFANPGRFKPVADKPSRAAVQVTPPPLET